MNIFIIPSWYPTKESPATGLFFKEQACLYASIYTEDNLAISRWGQGEFIIDLFSPLKAIKKIFSYTKARYFENKIMSNVVEFYSPAIEIRPRRYAGGISQIVKANINNFKVAKQQYGHIDVIHAHVSFPAGFVALKLSQYFGIPYVLTEHMGPFPFAFYLNGDKLNNRLSSAFNGSVKVVAVSDFLKQEMSNYDIRADVVIPDFIDDDFFVFRDGDDYNDEFVFFAVGRVTKEKGVDIILKSFAKFAAKQSNVRLKIGGVGGDMLEMVELANNLGIASMVEWLGTLDKNGVKTNMQKCNVFVTASVYETFGVAVSEALCCGKPVISTKCGGVEDMLNSNNSILTKIGSTEEMCMAMQKMYDNISMFNPLLIRNAHISKFGKRDVSVRLRNMYVNILESR
jgi:glycosyltransferase involved in cell wall biosynthesis